MAAERTSSARVSRRSALRTALPAALVGGAALAGATRGRAPRVQAAQDESAPGIVGSWRLTAMFTTPPDRPPATFFATFIADGGYIQSSLRDRSTGHGAWRQTGERTYTLIREQFLFADQGAAGEPATLTQVRATLLLDASGNTVTGTFDAVPPASGTVEGSRIRVES